ncbi:MAG TPA: glycosyl hydrolase, partial [Solibacterales bacterium]|nr:glycosyl hydrolase [Bryobacterales bacterium]
ISPDLTTNDPKKQQQNETGGLTLDNSTAENHCTIYSIAESPLDPKVIWVGTDDGNVHLTRDGGKTWKNLTANVAGAPRFATISTVEAGRFAPGVAYLTIDNHQAGDFTPYAFVTRDFGATWQPLAMKGIEGWAHVVREDRVKADLLFLGTEMGLYITLDGGQNWAQFTGNFPAKVPVRDLAIHPRDHALIVGTHGRGIYIVDDLTPIRQITPAVLDSNLTVLPSQPAVLTVGGAGQGFGGEDEFVGQNPREAAWVTYYMKDRHLLGDFEIEILDADKKLVTRLVPGKRRGINRVAWAMRLKPPKVPRAAGLEAGALSGPVAPEGNYTARIKKGEEVYTTDIKLTADPRSPHPEADRKLQQKTTMALYRTLENLAFTTAAVNEARDSAEKLAAKTKENEALAKSLTEYAGTLKAFNEKLVITRDQGITVEQRLRERLGEVYGEVSRYGGKPTAQQIESAALLDQQAAQAAAEAETLLGKDLEALNAKLKAAALEPLKRLTREEFDKRP